MIGIMGALVMRAIFIAFGLALLKLFHPIIYVFGILLIYTAYKMIAEKDKEVEPDKNPVIRLFRRLMPVTGEYHGEKFFVKNEDPKVLDRKGNVAKTMATPLVLVLVAITMFDLVFAIDSIPAVLAVSDAPFIVYTSNVFAVLGLRAMYFALAGFVGMFRYLSYGLAIILAFIGVKLLISDLYHFPIAAALGVVVAVLAGSVLASVIIPDKGGSGHGAAVTPAEPPAHK
jgi:tellurite resistance protein TerC